MDGEVIAEHGPFFLTATGAIVAEGAIVTFEEWEEALKWSRDVEQSAGFWIGDLLNYGEAKYGEKYSQALEATPFAEKTLRNAASVANKIAPAQRRADVPYSHHVEVAKLPPAEQEVMLAKVADEGLTVLQLREQIQVGEAVAAGKAVKLWVVVECKDADDQTEFYNRMIAEGRAVKLKHD